MHACMVYVVALQSRQRLRVTWHIKLVCRLLCRVVCQIVLGCSGLLVVLSLREIVRRVL
jgi:hypothetical protein